MTARRILIRVDTPRGAKTGPVWSPDGSKIALRSTRDRSAGDIFVMNADGSGQTNLTAADPRTSYRISAPLWSPDGATILFMSEAAGNDDIWIMNADGNDQRALTYGMADDFAPDWSPR